MIPAMLARAHPLTRQALTAALARALPATLLAAGLAAGLTACSLPDAPEARQPVRQQAPPIATRAADRQCLAALREAGADFVPLPDRYLSDGCSNLGTVQLSSLYGDLSRLGLTNIGPVTCPVSTAFAGWARFGVDRAARQLLGSPVARIETFGSYACRNVARSSRRSAHATAEAIDVSGFLLQDGRRITVLQGWNGSPEEREFLRVVRGSACRRFATVLSPDYNADHRDHLHLEGVTEGTGFCR